MIIFCFCFSHSDVVMGKQSSLICSFTHISVFLHKEEDEGWIYSSHDR